MVYYEEPTHLPKGKYVEVMEIWTGKKAWMDLDTWFEPIVLKNEEDVKENLPPIFMEYLEQWRQLYKLECSDSQPPEWHVKGAAIQFTYDTQFYKWGPSLFGATQEEFEQISMQIEKDLLKIGCVYVNYLGTMD